MAAVAGTIVTSELSSIGDGDTAKVGADTEDDQPLGFLHTLGVSLRISVNINVDTLIKYSDLISPKGCGVYSLAICNLASGSVSDEQRLSTPFEGHVLT